MHFFDHLFLSPPLQKTCTITSTLYETTNSNALKEKVAGELNSDLRNSFKPDHLLQKQWCELQTKTKSDL